MEQNQLQLDMLEIFTGICTSKSFWEMQKNMKGEGFLLGYLMENGGVGTPGVLADLLGVSGARITAILTALQAKHFVERRVNLADKRRVTISLTDSGRAYVQGIRAQILAFAEGVCATLGEADTETLIRVVKKLIHSEADGTFGKRGA